MRAKIINLKEKINELNTQKLSLNTSDLLGLATYSSGVFSETYINDRYGKVFKINDPEQEKEVVKK